MYGKHRRHRGRRRTIEFYGGPLDGHVERFGAPLKSFVIIKTAPHAERATAFSKLLRLFSFYRPSRSVVFAVYELKSQTSKCGKYKCGYYYLPCRITPDICFDSPHVCVLAHSLDQSLKLPASLIG